MGNEAADEVEAARKLALQVVTDAGLLVAAGEQPSQAQVALAAIHAREDAALCAALIVQSMARQRQILRWLRFTAALCALTLVTMCVHAAPRSPAQRAAFARMHPCPTTGQARGACPGYVVDHVQPLCAGGADHPTNMQWQTVEAARLKDREEASLCRTSRR